MALLQAGVMALVGLVAGVLYSFGGAAIDLLVTAGWITTDSTPGLSFGTALAFLALLGMPAYFALFGLGAGLIGALLRNLVIGRVGRTGESGDGSPTGSRHSWALIVGGSALAGALGGAVVGALIDGGSEPIESTFGGAFFGALVGGCLLGNALGILRSIPR